jgi:hypothetical protein
MAFRILSLDGGGTWALLEAMALEDLYPGCSGHQILAHFDLAVANSGGSIVLAGLVLDMRPKGICNFFEDRAKRLAIFHKKCWLDVILSRRVPIFPRYVAAQKRIGLAKQMGELGDLSLADWSSRAGWPNGPLGEPSRVLIVAFDYDRLREAMLRSYPVPQTQTMAQQLSLVDAVHASTNAPVSYFDAPAFVGKKRYWDGAMGAYNNPLMAGVVDALSLGAEPTAIEILSIGTGSVRLVPPDLVPPGTPPDLLTAKVKSGVLTNATRAAGCITDDPPDAATNTAHIVLGNAPDRLGRVVRLSPIVQPVKRDGSWTYPEGLPQAIFDGLIQLGMDAVEDKDVDLIRQLGIAWIRDGAPNHPIRMRDDLTTGLGDPTYASAKARWQAMAGV